MFRYKRLMFGIDLAPEIFQRILEGLLSSCNNIPNYIDDVFIFGSSKEEHGSTVKDFLSVFDANNVVLNEGKCAWKVKELKFLGHVLSE